MPQVLLTTNLTDTFKKRTKICLFIVKEKEDFIKLEVESTKPDKRRLKFQNLKYSEDIKYKVI